MTSTCKQLLVFALQIIGKVIKEIISNYIGQRNDRVDTINQQSQDIIISFKFVEAFDVKLKRH